MSRVPIPPAVQLDRDAQGRADALAEQDPAELGPLRLGAEVPDGRRQALAEGYRTRALGEPFLAVLDRLGGLVGGAGPAQLAVGVDQHEPGPIGGEQLLGPIGDLLQGRGQALFRVQGAEGADALGQVGGVDGHGAACLSGLPELANRSAGQGAMRRGCRADSRPSLLGTEVVVRAVATVQMTPRRNGLHQSRYADRPPPSTRGEALPRAGGIVVQPPGAPRAASQTAVPAWLNV